MSASCWPTTSLTTCACVVAPRRITPRQMMAEGPGEVLASFDTTTGISNAPGTRTIWISFAPAFFKMAVAARSMAST